MIKALSEIEVITLFVEDLPAARAFYQDVFGLEGIYQDDVSAVVKLGTLMINLLQAAEAGGNRAGPARRLAYFHTKRRWPASAE